MAIYHHHVKIIGRGAGRSAVGAVAYRAGEKIHNDHDGLTHDYTHRNSVSSAAYRSGEMLHNQGDNLTHDFSEKRGIVYSEIILPKNAPSEFQDRATLWNAVEKGEKRKDAQTAREIEISLPKELNLEQQIKLTQEYVRKNFVNKGMIADFSIHHAGHEHSHADEFHDEIIQPSNPHAHIMLTMRDVEKDGFKGKNRTWNSKAKIHEWRKNWAGVANKHLEKHGFDERIDHRTLAEQGIDREPMKYMGLNYKYIKARKQAEIRRFEPKTKIVNPEILKIEREIKQLERMKSDLLKPLSRESVRKNLERQRQPAQKRFTTPPEPEREHDPENPWRTYQSPSRLPELERIRERERWGRER